MENCGAFLYSGLSILGGEPFCNLNITLRIARAFRQRFGRKTIWIWTGFLFEYLKHQTDERRELLELTDVLVDGLLCTNFINLICHIRVIKSTCHQRS